MKRVPRGSWAVALTLTVALAIAACGSSTGNGSVTGAAATTASAHTHPLKVALLLSGASNDGGFNQWAVQAAQKLQSEGLIQLQVRQNLTDPNAAEPVLREFAAQGYDLIIGHGIDLSTPTLKVAKAFPHVHFATTGDNTLATKLLPNVEGWTYNFGQFGYVTGVVAGKLEDIKNVGVVNGPNIPFVVAGLKGLEDGLNATTKGTTVHSIFTGEFYSAQKEQEAVRALVAQGAQVIIDNTAEGNGVAPAALAAKVPTVGVAVAGSSAARTINITSPRLNLLPVYEGYVKRLRAGTFGDHFEIGTLANKQIGIDPVNNSTGAKIPANLQQQIEELSNRLASGALKLPSSLS